MGGKSGGGVGGGGGGRVVLPKHNEYVSALNYGLSVGILTEIGLSDGICVKS